MPPFAHSSNGLMEVGERLSRPNVEFDTTVFMGRLFVRVFPNVRRISTSREFEGLKSRGLARLAGSIMTLHLSSHSPQLLLQLALIP